MNESIKDDSESKSSHKQAANPVAMIKRPIFIVATLLVYGGMILFFLGSRDQSKTLSDMLGQLASPKYLGIALLAIGFTLIFFETLTRARSITMRSFTDVDDERREKARFYGGGSEISSLVGELKELRSSAAIDYSKIEEIISKSKKRSLTASKATRSFEDYFEDVVSVLESRSSLCDEKASVLLDKGIFFVWFGIVFYLFAIAAWQTLIHWTGFKQEYAYGMVACSVLFLFIEFLSAWFLKQYRHFVDTATYLFKVKAIFDRHFLLYLALKGNEAHIAGDEKKLKTLADALTDEIKWPNDGHLTKADVAFAREAMDSISDLAKTLKSSRKEKKEKAED